MTPYSAVQRYVRAALAGLAPGPAPQQLEAFAREWEWRRHYRLAEAQQRILIHTENWIEPEIRPTKTPAFERLEQTLQSGPLTMQLADWAMKGYLTDLADVARLQPVAMVNHEQVDHDRPLAFRDTDLPGLHVFARTRAHPHRIFYRRRLPAPDSRWTPWERIDAEMQGTHYVALVAFGTLRVGIATVAQAIRARIRARFRLKATAAARKPEAAGTWPEDWVSSDEFCHTLRIRAGSLASFEIHADDTIVSTDAGAAEPSEHLGVITAGQRFVAEGYSVPFWPTDPADLFASAEKDIYAGPRAVALTVHDYELVVPRDRYVSHMSSPKLLDEYHARASEPARTFLIELQAGRAAPPAPPEKNDPAREPPSDRVLLPDGSPSWLGTSPRERPSVARADSGSAFTGERRDARLAIAGAGADIATLRDFGTLREVGHPLGDTLFEVLGYDDVWLFTPFWHPQAVHFRRLLEARGLPRLLRTENQALAAGADVPLEAPGVSGLPAQPLVEYFEDQYEPTRFVAQPYPRDIVDFTITGAYSEYNWELFFDAILYIAKRFDDDSQFDKAEEFFKLLLDTTKATVPAMWSDPDLFKTAPIRHALRVENGDIAVILDDGFPSALAAQFERIHLNPYQPHIIARGWPSVYARVLRIHYVQHLISWADREYRLAYLADDRTRLEIAGALYDRAAQALGPADDFLSATDQQGLACFASLTADSSVALAGTLDILEP